MSTPVSKEVSLHLEEVEEPSDSENELKRKMSSVSVYSTDGGEEEDDDDGENEDDDRKNAHVVLGPQLALKEQLEMDKVLPFSLYLLFRFLFWSREKLEWRFCVFVSTF